MAVKPAERVVAAAAAAEAGVAALVYYCCCSRLAYAESHPQVPPSAAERQAVAAAVHQVSFSAGSWSLEDADCPFRLGCLGCLAVVRQMTLPMHLNPACRRLAAGVVVAAEAGEKEKKEAQGAEALANSAREIRRMGFGHEQTSQLEHAGMSCPEAQELVVQEMTWVWAHSVDDLVERAGGHNLPHCTNELRGPSVGGMGGETQKHEIIGKPTFSFLVKVRMVIHPHACVHHNDGRAHFD